MGEIQSSIAANREQLRERVVADELFVHQHWASERQLVSYIPPHARTILDIGCGPTGGLLSHIPDMRYFGTDFVHQYLAPLRAQHGAVKPFEFSSRDWSACAMESLPFADASFDVVYARHSLEHSLNLGQTLSEIKRVLKPGGAFVFCVPARVDDDEPTHRMRWPARRWLRAFATIGDIAHHGQHTYFIDELFGYAVKASPKSPPLWRLDSRVTAYGHYITGQGLISVPTLRMLSKVKSALRRLLRR